ncbi:MAG: ATP-binding protein [Verrucomicrobiia bacterium]
MNQIYYYLVLISAAVSLAAAGAVWWKNRYQIVGPLWGLTFLALGVWAIAFAQYFRPLSEPVGVTWAKITLTASFLNMPTFFHSSCAMVGGQRQFRWWLLISYLMTAVLIVLTWQGWVVAGVKPTPNMDHYVVYNRRIYPLVGFHETTWPFLAGVALIRAVRQEKGYKRTQLSYFILVILTAFLTTSSIILPLEQGIYIQPVGFFIMPLNLAFLVYVLAKARLADFNVVIARVLLNTLTLLVVVGISLLFVGGMTLVSPGFMNQEQIVFTMLLVVTIGLGLAVALPRWLPRAERMMQERMFGKRYGYQDALAGLVNELSLLANIDEILSKVVATVHSQMQLTRVVILMQNPLSGEYQLQAESGLAAQEAAGLSLPENSPAIRRLGENKDALVRDEVQRRVPAHTFQELAKDLDRLKVTVCVPMILDGQLVGLIGLGEKTSKDMFFVSDLRLLENLGTEVALAVKYRRMEEEILRKNKLTELGTIAAGVAHEIRNPLASIKTFAQLLPTKADDPEFKNEFSRLVVKDVERITKVVETMLAFARPPEVKVANYSAAELVEEAVLLVQSRLKSKSIELTKQFHEQPVLRVDKQQILQVLVNLLNNAVDALPEHGKIRVATGVRVMEDAQEGNGSRRYGVIEVADNGPGIPAAVRNRLFDPFFTTKKEGTGLGLSISQKIARDHGGIITVSSIEGKGTTFQVNLPLN